MRQALRATVRRVLGALGYELRRTAPAIDPLCEGFDRYVREATAAGMDVNDWIEARLGWSAAAPLLEKLVVPRLGPTSRVCEIGAGTGRHARHIARVVSRGELHLVDHSAWVVSHLERYFAKQANVHVHASDGCTIPLPPESVDLCFANGAFIEMKLGTIMLYAREFARVLAPGGHAIFDYFDVATDEGWASLQGQTARYHRTFTYHTGATIDRVFAAAGFLPEARHQDGQSTYVVFTKTARASTG